MENKNTPGSLSRFCTVSVYLIGFLLMAVIFLRSLSGTWQEGHRTLLLLSLILSLVISAAAVLIYRYSSKCSLNLSPTALAVLLAALCLVVKSAFAFSLKLSPSADYYTFYHAAELLAQNAVLPAEDYIPGYVAQFPHIFGYAAFLSFFFRIFGASPELAAALNVILSLCGMLLIFGICRRLFSLKSACVASLAWIFCPSQCFYNSLVLSEPLYTTLILLGIYLAVIITRRFHSGPVWGLCALAAALGLCLRLVALCRPVAAIMLIALFIFVFLCRAGSGNFRRRIALFALITAVYALTAAPAGAYIDSRLGQESAQTPGYSLYVGFNTEYSGTWNADDSALLTSLSQESDTAEDAQQQMLSAALQRISGLGISDIAKLSWEKLYHLWGHDSACIDYVSPALKNTLRWKALCDGFYYSLLVFAALGAAKAAKRRDTSPLLLPTLFFIGLTLAHMLVEVAGRYHYSAIPCLMIMAASLLKEKDTA